MNTVFFDIEAGGLKAPFDQVYLAAFKPYGEEAYVLSRKIEDNTDLELCCRIRDELAKYDIVVTYYGLGYDKPFVSTRLLKQGEKPLPRQLHIDCYRIAKKMFKYTLISKRLVSICELLHIPGKTRVEPDVWEIMKYGTLKDKREALRQVREHCLWDVITLEKAYDKCFKHAIVSVSLA